MKNRKQRVEMMVDLIKNKCIGSQEELARLLEEAGFSVTQATLSRDLKMLKTTKIPTDRGGYMYMLPDSNSLKDKLLSKGQLPERQLSEWLHLAYLIEKRGRDKDPQRICRGTGLRHRHEQRPGDSRHHPRLRHDICHSA